MALPDLIDDAAAEIGFNGVVRVDLDGSPVLTRAYGLAHRALGIASAPDTLFAMASGSKTLTALAVLSLVESGELALDTTARSLLGDDLPLIDDRVTVEHLLSHRSGIGDYLDEDELDDDNDYVMTVPVHELATTEQFLAVLDGHPSKFAPGADFSYCNSGYVVLALLAERASRVAFHDLVDQRVCRPAGLVATSYLRSDELPGRAALGYLHDPTHEHGLRSNVLHLPVRGNGDGGAYTTAADLHILWRSLLDGRIVSGSTVTEMLRPRSEVPAESLQYGLGVWLDAEHVTARMIGGDAGVGLTSTQHLDGRYTVTVICNQSRGCWPMSARVNAEVRRLSSSAA